MNIPKFQFVELMFTLGMVQFSYSKYSRMVGPCSCFPTPSASPLWAFRFASAASFDPPCRCKPTWTARPLYLPLDAIGDWIKPFGQIRLSIYIYILTSWWQDFNAIKVNSIGPFPPEVAFLIQSWGTFNNQRKLPSCGIFALQVLFLQYFKHVNIWRSKEAIRNQIESKKRTGITSAWPLVGTATWPTILCKDGVGKNEL